MLDTSTIEPTKIDRIKEIHLPTKLSEDLAYLCGVLAGDGSIRIQHHKYNYTIKCVGNPKDEKEFYNEILTKLFLKLFNYTIKPKLLDSKTTYGFEFASKSLVLFFTQIMGLPNRRKDALEIPKVILRDEKLIKSFIQGLFDTDGCFTVKHKNEYSYPCIVFVSKSKNFVDEVKNCLLSLGFKIGTDNRKYFDARVNKTIVTYGFAISGNRQILKWMNEIGFRHPKHLKKFELWKENSGGKI